MVSVSFSQSSSRGNTGREHARATKRVCYRVTHDSGWGLSGEGVVAPFLPPSLLWCRLDGPPASFARPVPNAPRILLASCFVGVTKMGKSKNVTALASVGACWISRHVSRGTELQAFEGIGGTLAIKKT